MSKFKTRQGLVIDDLKTYVQNYVTNKPDTIIYIGCDSQVEGKKVQYAVSVCMVNPGKGGHIIDRKTSEPLAKTNQHRLWEEVTKSIEVAETLKDLDRQITIHCDYNSKPTEMSNILYESGLGYAKAMGYEAEGKPNAFAATYCANKAARN